MTPTTIGRDRAARDIGSAFREDINGLRAIAVLGVVLYHVDMPLIRGGYIGVDVFFVISGYLMTRIIVGRLEAGRFSLADFYRARVRRIVPALLAMVVALLAVGLVAIDPLTYAAIAREAALALLFVSNVGFYAEAGYFDAGSATKWLLHTWSLSVEWQFYLVYPLALAAIWRVKPSRRPLIVGVLAVGLASFALCVAATISRPTAAFFLLPMRLWEMLAGGLVALAPGGRPSPHVARALQATGLAAIALGMVGFDSLTAWPSYRAAVPVLGACLVIYADRRASRVIGNGVLRPIGRWSYALYIWHWPIVVSFRYVSDGGFVAPTFGTFAVAMIVVAAASNRQSRRFDRVGRLGRKAFATIFVLTLAAAIALSQTNGLEQRRPALQALFAALRGAQGDWAFPDSCAKVDGQELLRLCSIAGHEPGRVLVIGDSEAQTIFPRWTGSGADGGHASLSFLTYGGCPTLPDVDRREPGYRCRAVLDAALAFAEQTAFDRVVFTSLWAGYFTFGTDNVCFPAKAACPARTHSDLQSAMADAVARLKPHIERLRARGTDVVLLLPIPYSVYDIPTELAKRRYLGQSIADVSVIDRARFLADDELARAPLKALAAATGASLVDPVPVLCDAVACPTGDATTPSFYRDRVHIRASIMRSDRFAFLDALMHVPAPMPTRATR